MRAMSMRNRKLRVRDVPTAALNEIVSLEVSPEAIELAAPTSSPSGIVYLSS